MRFRRAHMSALIWLGLAVFLLLNLERLSVIPTDSAPIASSASDSPVIISEFLASNRSDFVDEDGDASDWIELFNRSDRPINLEGWSLTDDPARPDKWVFGDITLGVGEYLIVFASGKDRFLLADLEADIHRPRLHTNFSLSSDPDYLALHPPTSRRYLDGSIFHYPSQQVDVSFGIEWPHAMTNNIELDERGAILRREFYFDAPTPGAPNDMTTAWAQVLAEVTIDPPAGFYDASFAATLTTDDREVVIHYTTDGSEPSLTNGIAYTGPITIAHTTPLRAAAVRPDYLPGPIATHTYLFVDDIVAQDHEPPGFPTTWGEHDIDLGGYTAGAPRAALYAMDPRIVEDTRYGPMVRAGLETIPSVSLVLPVESLDIYAEAHARGREFERALSMEFLYPDDTARSFQIDGGIRMHGGAGRWSFMPKHSFRLYFRSDYGPSRLREPIFPDSPAREFNRLVLRAGSDRSFVGHPPAPGNISVDHRLTTYTRDEWARASQIAMSGYGSHGIFVHLYINGVYWGLYNLVERLDTAFAATYLGGDEDDWFSVTQGGMRPGQPDRFLVMLRLAEEGGLADPERYATVLEFVDPIQFSDYVILQWYMGNRDWPENNWTVNVQYPAGRNLFFVWDAEDTWHDGASIHLGGEGHEDAPFPNVIKLVFDAVWENPDFRLLFADRLYFNLHHDGPLTDQNAQARWRAINETIELAIAAESARWGYERYAEPITPDDWTAARDLVLAQMEGNAAKLLNLAREAGYYPPLDAPEITPRLTSRVAYTSTPYGAPISVVHPGGDFEETLLLALNAPAGEIYYTVDGTDPREPETGAISAAAQVYGAPFEISTATVVQARARMQAEGGEYVWSARHEARFQPAGQRGDVRITEIMYNPVDGGDFEFLEIKNVGEVEVDLSGAYFEGIRFRFPEYVTIAVGERFVLARDFSSYRSRYPEAPIHGIYEGRLSNQGETITLRARNGELWDTVTYGVDERWPMSAAGAGDSLVRWDLEGDPDHPDAWRASAVMHGSPGAADGVVQAYIE